MIFYQILNVLIDRLNIHLSEKQIKATLQDLKNVGYVYTESIFDDEMKLNGVGWFCKEQYRDNIFSQWYEYALLKKL